MTLTRYLAIVALFGLVVANSVGQDQLKSQPPLWAGKPDVAAFEKIEGEKLAAAQRSVDAIAAVKGSWTIDNTLARYDEAMRQLNAAVYFARLMQAVHPSADFRDHATAMVSKTTSAVTELSLNRDVYHALASLDLSNADAATRYYVERQLLEFRLAGVDKDDATRAKLKQLNDDLTNEQSQFERNISDDQKSIEVSDSSELAGVPQDYIDRHKPGPDGKIHISTNYPDFFPVMTFAKSDDLRKRLGFAFANRAYPKNDQVLRQMMQTRYEIATLLGYGSWADYNAADKMIRNGQNIAAFIQQVDTAARPEAQREFAMLLEQKQKDHPGAKEIWDYDNSYYPEMVRRASYGFDSQSVRPYFPYAQVKQGILDTAARLFQVSFRQEKDATAWDPLVETWDVIDHDKAIGRIYLDMHPRPGKFTHAEMSPVLDGIRGKQLPEAILICNFPAPTASDPGLMQYDDVQTFFHEFGHLMHWILGGQQSWAGISGISMESDFVEAPSQMLEELIRSPQVLAGFAHHYQTGEPIPADLVARMNRAAAFGRGGWVARQNAYTSISFDLYKANPKDIDIEKVSLADLAHYAPISVSPDTHMYDAFGHLAGYSSAYYTYLWDKVIALDFFSQFDPQNPLSGDTPMRYRRLVLEPGGSVSANSLVKDFLGREQNTTAFEHWMGQEFQDSPSAKGGMQ